MGGRRGRCALRATSLARLAVGFALVAARDARPSAPAAVAPGAPSASAAPASGDPELVAALRAAVATTGPPGIRDDDAVDGLGTSPLRRGVAADDALHGARAGLEGAVVFGGGLESSDGPHLFGDAYLVSYVDARLACWTTFDVVTTTTYDEEEAIDLMLPLLRAVPRDG